MYLFSGGGYGGWWQTDGLTNGCSSVGISKTQPVEILEQHYPILFDRFALREGSGGAGRHRGGFGVDYQIRLLRGEATASFLMDHGRVGPPGLLGGSPGAVNEIALGNRLRGLADRTVQAPDGPRRSEQVDLTHPRSQRPGRTRRAPRPRL